MANRRYRGTRSACVVLGLLTATSFAAPSPAAAQQGDWNVDLDLGPEIYIAAVGVGVVLLTTPVFVVADLVYAADREWLPPLGAGLELGLVAVPWLAVGTALFVVGDDDVTGLAAMATVLGVGFGAHAIASLLLYRTSEREVAPPRKTAAVRVTPWVAPDLQGAGIALTL